MGRPLMDILTCSCCSRPFSACVCGGELFLQGYEMDALMDAWRSAGVDPYQMFQTTNTLIALGWVILPPTEAALWRSAQNGESE